MFMGFQCFEFSLGLEMFVLGKIAGGPKECQGRKLRIYKTSLSGKIAMIGLRVKKKGKKFKLDSYP